MNDFLWPAKRQRKERMRAAVQHSTGMSAVGRMVSGYVESMQYQVYKICVNVNEGFQKGKQDKDCRLLVYDKRLLKPEQRGQASHSNNSRARTPTLECTVRDDLHVTRAKTTAQTSNNVANLHCLPVFAIIHLDCQSGKKSARLTCRCPFVVSILVQ
jgi:hypothetical protein